MEVDEDIYHATPQLRGKNAHATIDNKKSSHKDTIMALPIYSARLGLMGKIDIYRQNQKQLIERKYQLKQIYQGQRYQLWAQYFCLIEMGYQVEYIEFYETSTNRSIPIPLPTETEYIELELFIQHFKEFDPATPLATNNNKCKHCIYVNLCDKTTTTHVY